MISFACQDIEFSELLRCSFELSKTEYYVFLFLLQTDKEWTVANIAKKMRLNRTTIQKAIKNLTEKQLAFRRQRNLDAGGYIFYYRIKNKDEIKKRMNTIVSDWYEEVKKEITAW